MSTASSIEPPPSLTPAQSAQHVAEARKALEASMLNIGSTLDNDLKIRAANLHSNNAALEKQQTALAQATKDLAKETDKLKKVADEAAKKLKELGNVQNWAEVLERDFVVLEETLKMVERGSDEEDELCQRCDGDLGISTADKVVWCEDCDGLWHTKCAGLSFKPDGKWTCAACTKKGKAIQTSPTTETERAVDRIDQRMSDNSGRPDGLGATSEMEGKALENDLATATSGIDLSSEFLAASKPQN